MNAAHLHLTLNHLPILGTLFGIFILAVAFFSKSEPLKRMSFTFFVLAALLAVPAFLTGEPAEDIVEKISGINKASIESHEELAKIALGMILGLGAFSVAAFFFSLKDYNFKNVFAVIVFVFSLVVFAVAAKLGSTGGEIRHTEITSGSLNSNKDTGKQNETIKEKKEKEDDD